MSVPSLLFQELEQLIYFSSAHRQAETLRRITALFLDRAAALNDEHVALFDDVMRRLMERADPSILAELAGCLAPVANAPAGVMSLLAMNDNIEIAGPALEHTSIAARDLLKIAQTKSQAHLLRLSSRNNIDEILCEILITRGNRDVVLSLLNNTQARLSENAFIFLAKKAQEDTLLADRLLTRKGIPPRFFRQLWIQAHSVTHDINRANRAEKYYGTSHPPSNDIDKSSMLSEAHIVALAKTSRYEEMIEALAARCTVPLDVIHRLMSGNRLDPLLILGRAAGFSWAAMSVLISARPGPQPTDQMLGAASLYFHRLTASAAERVVRFWQARPESSAWAPWRATHW